MRKRSFGLLVLGLTVIVTLLFAGVLYQMSGSPPLRASNIEIPAPASHDREPTWDAQPHHVYIRPVVERYLEGTPKGAKVLDLGCGDGRFLASFEARAWKLYGLDIDAEAIERGSKRFPSVSFSVGDATRDLSATFGRTQFDVIISTEVIEHVYDPRGLVRNAFALLKPRGVLVMTTPYHGYLKNLLIAVMGKTDSHFNPLADYGHIKFFSVDTLSKLLLEAGFTDLEFTGAGRFPYLWKSMIVKAVRP